MFTWVSNDLKIVGFISKPQKHLFKRVSKHGWNISWVLNIKHILKPISRGVGKENLFGFDLKSSFQKVKHFKIHKKMNHRIKSSDSS